MVYNGKPYIFWLIWGYHYFRKHPCVFQVFLTQKIEAQIQPENFAQDLDLA